MTAPDFTLVDQRGDDWQLSGHLDAAVAFDHMVPYYRGARFAAVALGRRFPEAKDDSDDYVAQLDSYIAATKTLYKARQSGA